MNENEYYRDRLREARDLLLEVLDELAQIREMAEAHAEAHPDCAGAMTYIIERCNE